MPRKQIHSDAWHLEPEELTVLAAIASAKEIPLSKIESAGIEADQTILDRMVSLDLVKTKTDETDVTIYCINQQGRDLLWHRRIITSGYPIFAHTEFVRMCINFQNMFDSIPMSYLKLDTGLSEEEIHQKMAKLIEHNMVERTGEDYVMLEKSGWKMDF